MVLYIVKRLVQAVPTLLIVLLIGKALVHVSGDPTFILLPPDATPEQRTAYRKAHGLDQPFVVQYVQYVITALRGDLGNSLSYNEPAARVVLSHLPATLELTGAAMALSLVIAIPVGILSALKRQSIVDYLGTGIVLLGQSISTFWLGIMLILVFAVYLPWLPASGRGTWQQLILPSITLALWALSLFMRIVRSSMLEVLSQDYIRTARAKGLHEHRVLLTHAFRNAALTLITVVGLQFGALLGGALVTETVFAWPGIGTLLLAGIENRDYPLVLAILLIIGVGLILINLVIDLIYAWIDPRIRVA